MLFHVNCNFSYHREETYKGSSGPIGQTNKQTDKLLPLIQVRAEVQIVKLSLAHVNIAQVVHDMY